jgi:hypothetical protein
MIQNGAHAAWRIKPRGFVQSQKHGGHWWCLSLGHLDEAVLVGGGRGGGGGVGGGAVLSSAPSAARLQLVGPEEAHAMVAPPFRPAVGKPNLKGDGWS